MPEDVSITGNGVAACCAARLLSQAGYRIYAHPTPRLTSPVLMLSDQTQTLIRDVFGLAHLFNGAIPITTRVVLWGNSEKPVTLPHSGLVISESTLLDRLWNSVPLEPADCDHSTAWNVISSRAALPPVVQHEFGSRTASTNTVKLTGDAPDGTCWVESVADGWLFLIPSGTGTGSLISVGAGADKLLAQSRLVAKQIQSLGTSNGSFPAYPRLVTPLCATKWIACGTAAVAFDPIAGEGTGNAIREGILASAVIRASAPTGTGGNPLTHYSNRILSGFLRHLQDCCRFYETVPGPWWETELETMKRGVQWSQRELQSNSKSMFRLVGFELQNLA
jgi:2-polyprenyl-6-methoxyphenol hydroxylase-like FAD-dependent oxidoreductase